MKKKLSAPEFKKKFLRMLDKDLSKLDPADRLDRATRAYAKAVRVCHGIGATNSCNEGIASNRLVGRTHVE